MVKNENYLLTLKNMLKKAEKYPLHTDLAFEGHVRPAEEVTKELRERIANLEEAINR